MKKFLLEKAVRLSSRREEATDLQQRDALMLDLTAHWVRVRSDGEWEEWRLFSSNAVPLEEVFRAMWPEGYEYQLLDEELNSKVSAYIKAAHALDIDFVPSLVERGYEVDFRPRRRRVNIRIDGLPPFKVKL